MASEDTTQNFNEDSNKPQPISTPKPADSQLNQILSGWGNRIKDAFGVLDEETKTLSERRLLHCNSCYMRTKNTCDPRKTMTNNKTGEVARGCGCNIAAKSMSPTSACPLGIWDRV